MKYMEAVVAALNKSIEKRFKGIFDLIVGVPGPDPTKVQFCDMVYLCAALLDPGLVWIETDVDKRYQGNLKQRIAGTFMLLGRTIDLIIMLY